ncbi:hypothetical protein BDN72DRAFT_833584 [Pluteus cervinus]|uniref:Uncharacterized protein n=1 Tax=Pluteus cervinus TaxID=181527 RepID=A0ACD3B980_9AGAR|nr:hypothetical protein BDN72DRAFT_833584 [Pluteus cervinus]
MSKLQACSVAPAQQLVVKNGQGEIRVNLTDSLSPYQNKIDRTRSQCGFKKCYKVAGVTIRVATDLTGFTDNAKPPRLTSVKPASVLHPLSVMTSTTSPPHQIHFHDLPVELQEQIVQSPVLSRDDLLNLAKTSRRINTLAIRRFFDMHQVTSPTEQFRSTIECVPRSEVLTNPWFPIPRATFRCFPNVLQGLAIAFDIKSIEDFQCTFRSSTQHRFSCDLKPFRRFIQTIQMLEHVRNVSLTFEPGNHFGVVGCCWCLTEWKDMMGTLLNTFVERGCESLTICNGDLPVLAITGRRREDGLGMPLDKAKVPRRRQRNIFRKTRSLFSPKPKPASPTIAGATLDWVRYPQANVLLDELELAQVSEEALRSSQLRHLQISSRTLLQPPCSHWTYSMLQTPNLTSLHLHSIKETTWPHIFSWMLPPLRSKLLELSIEGCPDLPTTPLIDFVTQLQALTRLKLAHPMPDVSKYKLHSKWGFFSRSGSTGHIPDNGSTQILPNLISLHAFPDWIQLLCPASPSSSSSSLSLVLSSGLRLNRGKGWGRDSKILSPLPSRPKLQHLHIYPRTFSTVSRLEFRYTDSLSVVKPILVSSAFPWSTSSHTGADSSPKSKPLEVGLEIYDSYSISQMQRDIIELGGGSGGVTVSHDQQSSSSSHPPTPNLPNRPTGYELYDRITELVINNPGVLRPANHRTLCEFLAMWKGVKKVEVKSVAAPVSRRSIVGGSISVRRTTWREENVERLLKEAKVVCPNVEVFVLGEKEYRVTQSEEDDKADAIKANGHRTNGNMITTMTTMDDK